MPCRKGWRRGQATNEIYEMGVLRLPTQATNKHVRPSSPQSPCHRPRRAPTAPATPPGCVPHRATPHKQKILTFLCFLF